MSRASQAANALVDGCLRLLTVRGVFAWRTNNAPSPVTRGGAVVAFRRVGMRGVADILGVLPGGRFVAVECKYGSGRLSPEQRLFRDRVTAAGGLFVEARSVEDVDAALRVATHNAREGGSSATRV